jgi:ABC-type dipeptide/oligopeptide/nickel transport system permease component
MDEDRNTESISAWDGSKAKKPAEPPKTESVNKKPKMRPKWLILLILWAVGVVPEIALHFYSAKGGTTLWNCGVYFPVLMALVPALLLYGIAYLIGKKGISYGILVGYSFLSAILCASQIVYYCIFGSFYSINLLSVAGDAFQFTDAIGAGISDTLHLLVLCLLPPIGLAAFGWRLFDAKERKWQWGLLPLALALVLHFGTVAALARFSRAELSEALTAEYLLLARAKGLSRRKIVTGHALRNAMVPVLPMILGEFVGILGGSLIIESIFSIPGVGNLYTTAISVRDYNFFMALTFFYTLVGLTSALLVDLSYGFIDPRIKMGEK